VCITKKAGDKPVCNYTAKLLDRNQGLDLSLLKIDPLDISGNPVNYEAFPIIEIDFDTVPQTQDEVIAIGYPWIGADTISQTKGIISGTSEYNGYRYLKTDTLIAGGNSGGALINKLGKLVGIPTFTIGGWGDGSL
jgi:S1-C subfamily serine protease